MLHAYLHNVHNKYTKFEKYPLNVVGGVDYTNPIPQAVDGQTDGRTDKQEKILMPPDYCQRTCSQTIIMGGGGGGGHKIMEKHGSVSIHLQHMSNVKLQSIIDISKSKFISNY